MPTVSLRLNLLKIIVISLVLVGLGTGVVASAKTPSRAATAISTTYYVSTSGNDRTGTGSSTKPWRTPTKAAATAPAGATVYIKPGTYSPFAITKQGQVFTSTTSGGVSIKGKAGVQDVVRVAASNVTIKNMTVYGCVPSSTPSGSFEDNGSSGVRIHDGASDVTITNMTIRDGKGTNTQGLPFGCYGIMVHDANGSIITGNNIYGNGTGIFFQRGGQDAQVTGNDIHDNNVIIRNSVGNNDDYGASAVVFSNVSTAPGPVVSGNTIKNNIGPSSDYGTDGGGFEIYNSSNLTITGNTITNNENILETGAPSDGSCLNNTFTGNTATGKVAGSTLEWSKGMILRCSQNMVIDGNTFNDIDWWVYVITAGDVFSSSIDGMRITNNTINNQWQKVYALDVDPSTHNLVIDTNHINFTGPIFSSYLDGSTSPSLSDWQTKTSYDLNSTAF